MYATRTINFQHKRILIFALQLPFNENSVCACQFCGKIYFMNAYNDKFIYKLLTANNLICSCGERDGGLVLKYTMSLYQCMCFYKKKGMNNNPKIFM